MLIWINGPFGVGKTQTAHELHRRLPESVLCDPESVGFGLHGMIPPGMRGDFQDLRSWRAGVVEALDLVLRKHNGPVIAPMTVIRNDYFAETVGALRESGHEVRHFALLAARETVLNRLRERVIGHTLAIALGRAALRRESFAVANLDECLAALAQPEFAEQVVTDELTIEAVAEHIATGCGLSPTPADRNRLRRRVRRAVIGVRHIRL